MLWEAEREVKEKPFPFDIFEPLDQTSPTAHPTAIHSSFMSQSIPLWVKLLNVSCPN